MLTTSPTLPITRVFIMKKCTLPLFALALILSPHAQAANNVDILPVHTAQSQGYTTDSESTHPPLRLTPDKSELIRLKEEAATILIGNPNHISILAENSQTLVIIPHNAGASHFTVLNKEGEIIMQRHVITAAPKQNYVRIRRSCANSESKDCQETTVFYCPDMCHSIQTNEKQEIDTANSAPKTEQPGAEDYVQEAVNRATSEQEPTEN